jgi:8-amino-7-oxononanoate synthase
MPGISLDVARSPMEWAEDVLLADLRDGLLRQPRLRGGGNALHCIVDGRHVVEFSSNDYLGLSLDRRVREAASNAALECGVGSTGSRHQSGSHELMVDLEAALCSFEGTATATLAPTGYAANMSALEALGGRDAVIFSDELNHASIADGCTASRSRVELYAHGDLDSLESMLIRCTDRPVIVSDGVFAADGTIADIAGLRALAHQYGAWLLIDEAHAIGVVGPGGRGTVAAAGLEWDPLIVKIVTFSKTLGASGAAICGADTVRQLLFQRGRPLIYSTALPHPVIAAVAAALRILRDEPERIDRLRDNTLLLHELLDGLGAAGHRCEIPMIPIVVGDATRAVEIENLLWESGWMVHALRPPTVVAGTSRLRVVVSALHGADDIRGVAKAIRSLIV